MVITRIIDFPDGKAKAMVIQDADGNYNIYLNGRLSAEDRLDGYLHELKHIEGDHFELSDVQIAESKVRTA